METTVDFLRQYFRDGMSARKILAESNEFIGRLAEVANLITDCFRNGGKVMLAGNGGSAADAQHIAAEFVSRFFYDRPGLPAIALTTDTSALTAIGNDYGFDYLFSRQVEALGSNGDIFIGITTSGNSSNILEAMRTAKKKGVTTVALCGSEGKVGELAEYVIRAQSDCTPFIQECHIVIGHALCAHVEQAMFPRQS